MLTPLAPGGTKNTKVIFLRTVIQTTTRIGYLPSFSFKISYPSFKKSSKSRKTLNIKLPNF
jgi:hypothetical protein